MLKIGIQAPELEAQDQDGRVNKLTNYRGQWVLVCFCPKVSTPGFVEEANMLHRIYPDLQQLKALALVISTDSVTTHKEFVAKHDLPFSILTDFDDKISREYKIEGQDSRRISYLVNPEGDIVKIYLKLEAEELLKDIKNA
jgi:peroxiredoxin Q/BCP